MYRFAAYPVSMGFVISDANYGVNDKICSWAVSGYAA